MSIIDILAGIEEVEPTPILVAPHPVLRQKARAVAEEDMAQIRAALPGMFSAMYKAPGIGLAAPQVGLSLRLIIIDLADRSKEESPAPLVLINPEILETSEATSPRQEGCLSLPNQFAEVERPDVVKVRYLDLNGSVVEREEDGLLGTCIQHEIDHLEGKLFVDHLTTLKRNMIMRRLNKEQKRRH
ncbi:peptide deformylase [Oecophyllibacter saccharovorans]|uniref:peptide deformylase n=1 Tax=Oecophyllibacter saccharovorans TaxID=2558360 RepID=UPI00116BD1BE|nr:peptide deformylase [Oecophyllibacter saccharovorans]TPW36698.1 peptide deformylase [Oecophyllibacter saccharovorans]